MAHLGLGHLVSSKMEVLYKLKVVEKVVCVLFCEDLVLFRDVLA